MSNDYVDLAFEQTFVMLKPDAVMRGLVGEIIKRFEQRGLKVIALKMLEPTKEQIDQHYPKEEAWIERLGEKTLSTYEEFKLDAQEHLGSTDKKVLGQQVRDWLMDYMTMGPTVAMIVEGVHACSMVRKLIGDTRPLLAIPGTIRGDFSVDAATAANTNKRPIFNLVHASETAEEATHEIAFWFKPAEIFEYYRSDDSIAFGDRRHVDFTKSKR